MRVIRFVNHDSVLNSFGCIELVGLLKLEVNKASVAQWIEQLGSNE